MDCLQSCHQSQFFPQFRTNPWSTASQFQGSHGFIFACPDIWHGHSLEGCSLWSPLGLFLITCCQMGINYMIPSGKEYTCQRRRCKRCGFDPWVGKIPWSRKWQPTPVFLPRKFCRPRSQVGRGRGTDRGAAESQTWLSTHTQTQYFCCDHVAC